MNDEELDEVEATVEPLINSKLPPKAPQPVDERDNPRPKNYFYQSMFDHVNNVDTSHTPAGTTTKLV